MFMFRFDCLQERARASCWLAKRVLAAGRKLVWARSHFILTHAYPRTHKRNWLCIVCPKCVRANPILCLFGLVWFLSNKLVFRFKWRTHLQTRPLPWCCLFGLDLIEINHYGESIDLELYIQFASSSGETQWEFFIIRARANEIIKNEHNKEDINEKRRRWNGIRVLKPDGGEESLLSSFVCLFVFDLVFFFLFIL